MRIGWFSVWSWKPGVGCRVANQINRISWDESKIYVDLTKEAVLGSQGFDPSDFGVREHDPRLFVR